jgi:hypothetical protein
MLYQSWTAQQQIEEDCDTLQRLKQVSEKVTTTLSAAPCHAGISDKVGGSACGIVDLENKIEDSISNLVKVIARNRDIIAGVRDDNLRILLIKRYLNHKNWDTIAYEMKYRVRGIHRVHDKALMAAKISYEKIKA